MGHIGSGLASVLESVSTSLLSGGEAAEMTLKPGEWIESLQGVPARFVQLAAVDMHEVARLVEAVETQRAARRQRWTALPRGTKVQVSGRILPEGPDETKTCPHVLPGHPSKDRTTCSRCMITDSFEALGATRELRGEIATVVGPYIEAFDSFEVALTSDGSTCKVSSWIVQPLVTKPPELASLQQFQSAQQKARSIVLNLPVGQIVELCGISDSGVKYHGQLATISGPFDRMQRSYTVQLVQKHEDAQTQEQRGKASMAAQYGVNDLLGLSLQEMHQLWSSFELSRRGLHTPDAFIEDAISFLPEVRPSILTFRACCLRPVIQDAAEVIVLEERHLQELESSRHPQDAQESEEQGRSDTADAETAAHQFDELY